MAAACAFFLQAIIAFPLYSLLLAGLVKLETRIPAGFLSGLTALVPAMTGFNLEVRGRGWAESGGITMTALLAMMWREEECGERVGKGVCCSQV